MELPREVVVAVLGAVFGTDRSAASLGSGVDLELLLRLRRCLSEDLSLGSLVQEL